MSDETGRNARQRSIRMLGGDVKERVWARPLATRCLSLLLDCVFTAVCWQADCVEHHPAFGSR